MSGHKMALLAEESDCYQLVNCMYRCKRLKALRSRHLKEYHHHHHHHMLRYRFEQEILILERVQESQEKHRLFKYNNKRCNCKIKNVDSHIHSEHFAIDTTDRHPSNASNSWTSRDINCSSEICASMIAGVWHRPSMVQHTPSKSDGPTVAVGCSKIWSPLRQSQMGAPLPPLSPPSAPSPPVHQASSEAEANSATYATSYLPIVYDSFDCIETISTYCDIASDYMKNSVSSKINLITYKKKQSQSQSQSETQSHQQQQQQREREQEQEQERHRNVKHRPSGYYYLWMMFIMVVKEFIQYVSRSLRRMRRKTQYLLPIIILLQLLLAVPLTNCTSPPNETSSAVLSSAAAAFVPSMSFGAGIMNTSSQESPASGTPSISEKQPSPADSANSQSSHQYHAPVGGTSSSGDEFPYRSSGGGSITSYINHRINMRREPSSSYSNSGCHSCQMREQVKADNLESIKRHILLRLEMRILPNITAPPVPHTIIESFYKNQSFLANKAASSGGDVRKNAHSDDNDMDDPSLGSMSHSNDYINGYSRDQHHNDMQGDDPNAYSGDYNHGGEEDDEKKGQGLYRDDSDSDEFFSVVNRVYVFPTMPRMRHNRKAEILNFQFKGSDHSTVSQALLHVYLRGRDWIREYEPNLLNSKSNPEHNRREIVITISRVVRRVNSTVATHTVNVTESPHKIPNGLGEWISIDVTQLVQSWLRDTTTNQGIVIKGSEPWMKPFITTGDSPNNKAFTVYIEILTKDNRKRRSKRNTSMNCSESDNEQRCCRYPLVVNFTEFEWNWVVAPTSFDAYFCNGECRVGFMERYPHTHLVQLSTAPQPCCSPTKMSPLQLLYFNTDNILVMSTIPNMAVDQCSCS